MRLTTLAIVIITLPLAAGAQETETLFSGDVNHGGFGAPVYGITQVNGQVTYLKGIRGAWVINFDNKHAINLGLANYKTGTNFDPVGWINPVVEEPEMSTKYSGVEIEYVNRTHRLFHISIQTLVGSGEVEYEAENTGMEQTSDNYFVLQPGVNMNLNVTDWFRISGGLYYRFASRVTLYGTSSSDLSGFSSFVALRFGWF